MAVEVDIDVEVLKCEIKKTYARVSQEPDEDFVFPTGRAWILDLGYPPELVARLPEAAAESFAGVANPFALGKLKRGEVVGPEGRVTGVDMTPEMLAKAKAAAVEMKATNVEFVAGEAEKLPFADESFDVVISNGVIDLTPDKDAVFSEIHRVLRPGGRIQIADVTIQKPVSEEGRKKIDLWTG
jgi:arsenite methyltransferase